MLFEETKWISYWTGSKVLFNSKYLLSPNSQVCCHVKKFNRFIRISFWQTHIDYYLSVWCLRDDNFFKLFLSNISLKIEVAIIAEAFRPLPLFDLPFSLGMKHCMMLWLMSAILPVLQNCSEMKKTLFFGLCLNLLDLKICPACLSYILTLFSGSGLRNLPLTSKPLCQMMALKLFLFCFILKVSSTWSC